MTRDRWRRLLESLALPPDEDTYERLVEGYSQKHRKYHNVTHLEDCLAQLDGARHLADEPDEVEIALWFHDAIYEPYASDNEVKSAEWAWAFLTEQGRSDEERAGRVRDHILATLHDGRAESNDSTLLVDIDLSILGADEDEYRRFEAAVREEYRWVPRFVYRKKRRAILESFLARQQIYVHDLFRQRLEERARGNLEAAIVALA